LNYNDSTGTNRSGGEYLHHSQRCCTLREALIGFLFTSFTQEPEKLLQSKTLERVCAFMQHAERTNKTQTMQSPVAGILQQAKQQGFSKSLLASEGIHWMVVVVVSSFIVVHKVDVDVADERKTSLLSPAHGVRTRLGLDWNMKLGLMLSRPSCSCYDSRKSEQMKYMHSYFSGLSWIGYV
jgi:hypothetical protein